MITQRILTENTISVTEMRKRPNDYFTDEPIAVLSNNQPVGYMLGRELFETMVDLLRQQQPQGTFTAQFQPNVNQLKAATVASAQFLNSATETDLGDFVE